MTTRPEPRHFTAETFLAWAAEQPRGRFELLGGAVVAMAPERIAHARCKWVVANRLAAALAVRHPDCEAMIDGVAVRIDEWSVFEPDSLVRCGPKSSGEATSIDDPVIVVEVVSPSSRAADSGVKLAGYFTLPSLRHYLIVDLEARAVIHHGRDAAGAIATQVLRGGNLSFDPPGIEVEVSGFFPAR